MDVMLAFLALGAASGFMAGLLGIGGGLVIVPALVYLLPQVGVPEALVMTVALGTSFSTIVLTTFSAAQRHNQLGNVDWSVAKVLSPTIMLAVFIAGQFVSQVPREIMTKIFAFLVIYLAVRMFLSLKPSQVETKPLTTKSMCIAGSVIGTLSSFAGIGGGALIVPYLNAHNVPLKRAIGTSSLCGCLLGLSGALSFILSGWNAPHLPEYSLGYVYLPALASIAIVSVFTSKLGANATNKLPVPVLKKVFALMLVAIALNMFFK